MEVKLTWKYDPAGKEYFVWQNSGEINFSIFKRHGEFFLERDDWCSIGAFKKLKNAKLCAQIIING